MAKRKRLTPANPMFLDAAADGTAPAPHARAPIADVAADSSASAALAEVADELNRAREDGRMLLRLPLDRVETGYLVRDRLVVEDEEMQALIASLRERGQQTPIEVTPLEDGRYGLISGWRRCQALATLQEWGAGDGTVLALERRPDTAADAYRAMVEENEIRANLSYFERARIVDVAVQQGVYESHKKALQSLFSAASRAKRSKIGSFVIVVQMLGDRLGYPQAIGERLGLRLARLIDLYEDQAQTLCVDLTVAQFNSAEDEQAFLGRWVAEAEAFERGQDRPSSSAKRNSKPAATPAVESRPLPDLQARFHPGEQRLELSGPGLTEALHDSLLEWLADQR
ncbi:MAG: ParB N-terminal domain-containing protein [Paracoccaceae bacterium]|nr:ParB N-terminal domain-containing protein [Paracoccaceae bacterium]